MATTVISPGTNYNINNSPGWSTRLVYSYFGANEGYFDYVARKSSFDDDLFSLLTSYASGSQKGGLYSQSTNYDGSYLNTSKTFRIKGRFLVSSDSAGVFNMCVKSYHNPTTTILASTNNGNDHSFAAASAKNTVPVDFEITITALQTIVVPEPNLQYFMANGFYQYNYDDYTTGGTNQNNIYVPIWNTTSPYIQCGVTTAAQEFQITFKDSSNKITKIEVVYITIEEFS